MEKLTTVEIGGEHFPIRCDIEVLIALQDEYGDFSNFERLILGMKAKTDKDGNVLKIKNEEGEEVVAYEYSLPSLSALSFVLPIFVRRGLEKAQEQGEKTPSLDYIEAIKEADFAIVEDALAIYTEFERCFKRKKPITQRSTMSESPRKTKAKK